MFVSFNHKKMLINNGFKPDDLLGVAGIDGVDVFLQSRTRLGFNFLHLLQSIASYKQPPSFTVMWENLQDMKPTR